MLELAVPKPKGNSDPAILEALRIQPEIQLAILFGSVAADREHPDSDIDLAVDAGRPLTASEKMSLIAQLAERTGRPVDLVDLQTVGEPLLGQILKHGISILGSNTRYANLIRKHLLDVADFMPYRERILQARRRAWIGK